MTDHRQTARDLVARAGGLPVGPAKVALLEEAVGLADLHRDEDLGFEVRQAVLSDLYQASRPDLLLVYFSWCLAYADRHPERDTNDLLWAYRWVIDSLWKFPEITRHQIEAALGDMTRRYRQAGFSLRPVHVLSRRVYCSLGDRAAASQAHRAIGRCHRDQLSDCPTTEQAFHVYYFNAWRQDRRAVAAAEPFLDGREADDHYRIGVYGAALLPMARLGRVDEARKLVATVLRMIATRPKFLGGADDEIRFLSVIRDLPAAVRVFNQHFPVGALRPGRIGRFRICRAGRVLTEQLLRAGRTRVSLRVPPGLIPGVAGDRCPVPVLAGWLDRELTEVAGLADARNGTDWYSRNLLEHGSYHRLADRLARGESP